MLVFIVVTLNAAKCFLDAIWKVKCICVTYSECPKICGQSFHGSFLLISNMSTEREPPTVAETSSTPTNLLFPHQFFPPTLEYLYSCVLFVNTTISVDDLPECWLPSSAALLQALSPAAPMQCGNYPAACVSLQKHVTIMLAGKDCTEYHFFASHALFYRPEQRLSIGS